MTMLPVCHLPLFLEPASQCSVTKLGKGGRGFASLRVFAGRRLLGVCGGCWVLFLDATRAYNSVEVLFLAGTVKLNLPLASVKVFFILAKALSMLSSLDLMTSGILQPKVFAPARARLIW